MKNRPNSMCCFFITSRPSCFLRNENLSDNVTSEPIRLNLGSFLDPRKYLHNLRRCHPKASTSQSCLLVYYCHYCSELDLYDFVCCIHSWRFSTWFVYSSISKRQYITDDKGAPIAVMVITYLIIMGVQGLVAWAIRRTINEIDDTYTAAHDLS